MVNSDGDRRVSLFCLASLVGQISRVQSTLSGLLMFYVMFHFTFVGFTLCRGGVDFVLFIQLCGVSMISSSIFRLLC